MLQVPEKEQVKPRKGLQEKKGTLIYSKILDIVI
jgi:hypothetical protein